MSRRLSESEYRRTGMSAFKSWLSGEKDPYLGEVEMKPSFEKEETESERERRMEDAVKARESVYSMSRNVMIRYFNRMYRMFSVVFCIALAWFLLVGVADIPPFGHPDNPVNNEVSERYLEKGLEETGAVNAVTGMILDYRAFDTLGESHVLFIACCAVLILLRVDKNSRKTDRQLTKTYLNDDDVILQMVAGFLVPPIELFGIYIILSGHLGPGGGFSGGAVAGAGLILYLNAFGFEATERFFTANTHKVMCVGALACYSFAKMYSFFTGANGIHSIISLGTPGAIISSGLILVLNICVGVVVTATMYTFYVMFRRGGF